MQRWKIHSVCNGQVSAISGSDVLKLQVQVDMLAQAQELFGRQQWPCLHVLAPNLQQPLYNGPAHIAITSFCTMPVQRVTNWEQILER